MSSSACTTCRWLVAPPVTDLERVWRVVRRIKTVQESSLGLWLQFLMSCIAMPEQNAKNTCHLIASEREKGLPGDFGWLAMPGELAAANKS